MRHRLWALFDRLAISLLCGTVANLLIMCPPQHGKSQYWSKYFPAWWLSHNPEHRIILGSYAAGYAAGWGRATRDVVMRHGGLIGQEVRDDVSGAAEWKLKDHEGGMVTSGYEGGIAGRPAELAIVDDPIKDAATAASPTEKAKIWTWWEEELSARLQKGGRRVLLMTRRAVDDPIGRVLELVAAKKETWTIVKLPAIAEEDETLADVTGKDGKPLQLNWNRKAGEALVPELHDVKELEATRDARGPNTWAGLYQQRPYPRGGGDLKGEWFVIIDGSPEIRRSVRAWDLAASESPTAKQTAGVKIGSWVKTGEKETRYHILDVVAGRWNPGRRNGIILETAKTDGKSVPIVLEQEPGSGGIAQLDEIKRKLDGYSVHVVVASREGSKEQRADAMASQAGLGHFTLQKAAWNLDFKAEANSFPAGLIDMIDAAAHAYNHLAGSPGPTRIPSGFNGMALPGQRVFGTGRVG